MILWVDAQLSPRTAKWIASQLSVEAIALRDLGLRDAADEDAATHPIPPCRRYSQDAFALPLIFWPAAKTSWKLAVPDEISPN